MKPSEPKALTTTSYAVLHLLSLRSWTTYELAKQAERNLRFYWPRAERKLYDEPKNLVAHGLATVRAEPWGTRTRHTYSITTKGQESLNGWLDGTSRPPSLEVEAIARVFPADAGSIDQLRRTISELGDYVNALQQIGIAIGADAIADPPFPERIHINALVNRFMWEYSEALRRWSEWATAEIAVWQDVSGGGKGEWAKEVFQYPRREWDARRQQSGTGQ